MSEQLSLGWDQAPANDPPSAARRIDITLARLADIQESMSVEEQSTLSGKPWWTSVVLVSRLRAMERAEEEVLGGPVPGLADAYERLVTPGEHPIEALMRAFQAVYGKEAAA